MCHKEKKIETIINNNKNVVLCVTPYLLWTVILKIYIIMYMEFKINEVTHLWSSRSENKINSKYIHQDHKTIIYLLDLWRPPNVTSNNMFPLHVKNVNKRLKLCALVGINTDLLLHVYYSKRINSCYPRRQRSFFWKTPTFKKLFTHTFNFIAGICLHFCSVTETCCCCCKSRDWGHC